MPRLSLALKLAGAFLGVSALMLVIVLFVIERSTSHSFRSYVDHQEMMSRGGQPAPAGMDGMHNQMMAGSGPDEGDFFKDLRLAVVLGGLGGATLAALAGFLVAGRITAPLREIESAARAVARGDTSRRARVESADELGDLASSFNRMAADLERQERTRQQFVADVAHELRTPLAVLQAEIEALQDGVTAPTAERLSSLHEETEVLGRLVEDLRTLSLSDAGALDLVRAREPAAGVIGRGVQSMGDTATRAGVKLTLDLPDSLPDVDVDGARVQQVLMNLLSNALRHTPPDGEVRVSAMVENDALAVSVRDSGSGVPEEALPHLFDRFYRVDPSRSRESGGSGLGLAIARQLVRAHGGEISAANNPDVGATFTFMLPLSRLGEESESEQQPRGQRRGALPAPR